MERFHLSSNNQSSQLSLFDAGGLGALRAGGLPIRIRDSARARRLILNVLPRGTLEVVVPRGTRPQEVQQFIDGSRAWIEAVSRELTDGADTPDVGPPDVIRLAAIAREFPVDYVAAARGIRLDAGGRVRVAGADGAHALSLLRRWLLDRGRQHLKPWLYTEAARLGMSPRSVQIRLQRTRWGSCSSSGRISLNAALLFIPEQLVRYLLVHELCHLAHMNHSARYWSLVGRFEPNFKEIDRQLGEAWHELPSWIFEAKPLR